mgnify:FL=1
MKEKKFDHAVSVYQFMSLCGLLCKKKEKIKISHEIMMRKLSLRNEKFPEQIKYPKRVKREFINEQDLLLGDMYLVFDDYGKTQCYHINRSITLLNNGTEEERALKREQALSEYAPNQSMKPGYMKYLYRKAKKDLLEIEARREMDTLEETQREEESLIVTDKPGRLTKINKRRTRY